MDIAIATSTFYYLPFDETLAIISEAGFRDIQLDIYWQGGDWEMSQHLKGLAPKEVVKMVEARGLKILSIHDGGGVIERDSQSAINPAIYDYLEYIGEPLDYLIFHVPHKKTTSGLSWWNGYKEKFINDLKGLSPYYSVCIENLPYFKDYYVPLTDPGELYDFTLGNKLFINFDTTHYGQMNVDICNALEILKNRVKTVHVSDYLNREAHVFVGEGSLDLAGFIRNLDYSSTSALILECTIDKTHEMTKTELVRRLTLARSYLDKILVQ